MKLILSGAGLSATAFALCFSALTVPALMMTGPAFGQSVAQVGGPAEQPPAGFTGQQYVDSRGCLFMRAGLSGRTTWVPRIGRDRKAMCSETTPSQAAARLQAPDTAGVQPSAPQPKVTVGAPMETVASQMTPTRKTGVFAPVVVPGLSAAPAMLAPQQVQPQMQQPMQPQVQAQQAYAPSAAGRSVGCPASAPVLQTLPLNTGGTVTVCTRGDGTATGWVSPNYRSVGGAIRNPQTRQNINYTGGVPAGQGQVSGQVSGQVGYAPASGSGGYVQTVIGGQAIVAPRREAGSYKAAWKDDRLNPNRGLGTAQGWADQAQVWTNTTPANTYEDVARKKARKAAARAGFAAPNAGVRLTSSTMSGQSVAGAGRIYVQVGTFGQPSNAQNAAGRLAGMGLPVASAKGARGGQALVSIMAGPFATGAEAQQALAMARSAGFGDAFIR